ncbi:MAG TPA: HepT-like ribonuclease domain-containing protein [Rhizobiaceae bacterium]|nr:HepT-like ribonuclease domain-containing protein [Rhizobiaceae bacterium]
MPSDRTADYLSHILTEIDVAERAVAGLSLEEFSADELRLRAVVRCLEIISEASGRLPEELKTKYPDVPWSEIAGAGNIYRHGYDGVLAWRIWETAKGLHDLRAVVERELSA